MAIGTLTAMAIGGGIGIGGMSIFGGKGKKAKLPPQPQLGPMGQYSQSVLYSAAERAMAGGGLLAARGAKPFDRYGPTISALTKGYKETRPMIASYLNRMVPRADIKVREYAKGELKRGYYGGLQDLREQERMTRFEEQQEGMTMAAQLLGEEKRLGADIMSIYNQQQAQLSQMPTFGSQLGYGLGGAAGTLAASRYAQMMSTKGGVS